MATNCPYPFSDPYWTSQDQDYYIDMVSWGYPLEDVPKPFKHLIENGEADTYKNDYDAECTNK